MTSGLDMEDEAAFVVDIDAGKTLVDSEVMVETVAPIDSFAKTDTGLVIK